MSRKLFTSESVTSGHPDKVCDQISDAILDACLKDDPYSRVACETAISKDTVFVLGEITTKSKICMEEIVRKTIEEIGFHTVDDGFDINTSKIITSISTQSEDIKVGVDCSKEVRDSSSEQKQFQNGAGDQGMMFGYATDETPEYMPYSIYMAHKLTRRLEEVRKNQTLPYLRPDGKSQITVEYKDNRPYRIDTIVIAAQHDETVSYEQLVEDIKKYVIEHETDESMMDKDTKCYINSTGRFVLGGPRADSGLTGRKIIVDTYGGMARHGGGAFSGKDCTKVDRSGAYFARYVAKNVVAAKLAKKCEIQVSYAIGIAEPVSVCVDTFGTGVLAEEQIEEMIRKHFDFRPAAIIEKLKLREPGFQQTASYGHFGNSHFSWERLDMVEVLTNSAKEITG